MPKYWFRQKRFGYGATPNSWQGWVVSVVSCAALFGLVLAAPGIRDNGLRAIWLLGGAAVIMVPTLILVYRKTEGGWRWRGGR